MGRLTGFPLFQRWDRAQLPIPGRVQRTEQDALLLPDGTMSSVSSSNIDCYASSSIPSSYNIDDDTTDRYWIQADHAPGLQRPSGLHAGLSTGLKSFFHRFSRGRVQHPNSSARATLRNPIRDIVHHNCLPNERTVDSPGCEPDGQRSEDTHSGESSDATLLRHQLPLDPWSVSMVDIGRVNPNNPRSAEYANAHEYPTIALDPCSPDISTHAAKRPISPRITESSRHWEMRLGGEERIESSNVWGGLPAGLGRSDSGQTSPVSDCCTVSELFDRESAFLRFKVVADRLGLQLLDSGITPCKCLHVS